MNFERPRGWVALLAQGLALRVRAVRQTGLIPSPWLTLRALSAVAQTVLDFRGSTRLRQLLQHGRRQVAGVAGLVDG